MSRRDAPLTLWKSEVGANLIMIQKQDAIDAVDVQRIGLMHKNSLHAAIDDAIKVWMPGAVIVVNVKPYSLEAVNDAVKNYRACGWRVEERPRVNDDYETHRGVTFYFPHPIDSLLIS